MHTATPDAYINSPTYAAINREMRRDVEKTRSELARDLAAVTKSAMTKEDALQGEFEAALAKRHAADQAFALACRNVQDALAAQTSARAVNNATRHMLRKQLTESADPCIAAAITKTDDVIESERRHNAGGDRQAASDARLHALWASRAELEALLLAADLDSATRVGEILGRAPYR